MGTVATVEGWGVMFVVREEVGDGGGDGGGQLSLFPRLSPSYSRYRRSLAAMA